jgi:hypothetical protein
MKGKIFLYCCIILFVYGCKSNNVRENLPFTFDQAILRDDLPDLIVACGTVSTADALLFKSVNSDSCIVGVVKCVSLYGQNFFRKGAKYSLQGIQDNIEDSLKNWIVQNQYKGKNYPVFLITHISKVE